MDNKAVINRRGFIGSALAGITATAVIGNRVYARSPNNQINVAVVGMSRGLALARTFSQAPGCVVACVCDTDRNRLANGVASIGELTGKSPKAEGDFRRVLEDPDVDAMVFALPIHWHAPAAIMACQAGKHVYVEKPCCHNPHEGELLVAAARKYNRAVQMGNQRRSSDVLREAVDRLHTGVIGRIYFARVWYASQRGTVGRGVETAAPEHLDYDLWQGPAPRRPYKDNVIPYNWHWFWHWGTGEMGNNGTHGVDLGRWGLQVDYPIRVSASGGRYRFDDDQETPDTHAVTYDFKDGKTMTWEGLSCNQPGSGGNSFGVTFYGEEGSMSLGSMDYVLRDASGKTVEEKKGDLGDMEHVVNLLDAIRNNQPLALRSEIEEGYQSALLSHLGNIAYRTRHVLNCGDKGHILDDPEAQALWQREYEPGWEPSV